MRIETEADSPGVRCIRVSWERDELFKKESRKLNLNRSILFQDCLVLGHKHWYGGLLHFDDLSWPRRWNKTGVEGALTGELVTHGFLGLIDPFWVSADGYGVWVDSPRLLHVQEKKMDYGGYHLCLQSENVLQYSVCESRDVRKLYYRRHDRYPIVNDSQLAEETQILALRDNSTSRLFKRDAIPPEKDYASLTRNSSVILIAQDVHSIPDNFTSFAERELKLWSSFREDVRRYIDYNLIKIDIFNASMSSRLEDIIAALKEANPDLRVGGDVANYFSPNLLNMRYSLREKAVWLDSHGERDDSSALVLRDGSLWNIVDITRIDVKRWFEDFLQKEWNPYQALDFITGSGGTAAALPISSRLNISSGNPNFYSKIYAESLSAIPKVLSVPVGFRSTELPGYLSLSAELSHPQKIIPLVLSASLLGYDRLLLDFSASQMPSTFDRETNRHFRESVKLAMFFPAFRLPRVVFNSQNAIDIFRNVTDSMWIMRTKTILPHYEKAWKALKEGRLDGPVIRAMWWTPRGAEIWSRNPDANESLKIEDQFMVGNDLIVSFSDKTRIYLPVGKWKIPNSSHANIMNVTEPTYSFVIHDSPYVCLERVI